MSFAERLENVAIRMLRWSEKYTKTDMVYFARGSFWLIFSQVMTTLFSFALAVAFGHLATKDAYGNYRYILSLWGLVGAVSLSGIGTAVTQAAARGYEGSLRQGFWLDLKWSGGLVVCAIGGAAYYFFTAHNIFVAVSLLLVALFAPFLSGFSLFDPFLVGIKDFRRDGMYNTLNALFPTLALIAVLFFTNRAIIFVIVFFAGNVIADSICYFFALRRAANDRSDPDLLRYSAHLSVMGVINSIADKIDSLTIFALLGPINLAVYTFAIAVPEQIKQLLKLITPLSLPRFAQRPLQDIGKTIWKRTALLTLGTTLTVVLYILIAPVFFRIFFPLYVGSVGFSRWYALSIIATAIFTPLTTIFQAHKKTKELYLVTNTGSILLIVLLPILTYYFGIAGAIGSQFVYRIYSTALAAWQWQRMAHDSSGS